MTDVTIEVTNVTGQMAPVQNDLENKYNFNRFLQFPPQLPDAKDFILKQRQNIRPWLLFIQFSNFKAPQSLPRLSKRIMKNIEYFQSNYLFVFLQLIAYCLLTSPLLLIAIGGSFYAGYKLSKRHQQKKFILFGNELTLAQQYGIVAICSMPIFYLVGAGAAMFWVLGASCFIITLHAAFYNIDALVPKEDEFGLLQEV